MRLGLVGVGRIGAVHAETLRDLPQVEQVVLADADPVRAADTADKLGVTAASDVSALLREGLDGLVVAAATTAHEELVRVAADAGIAVFCEKQIGRAHV